MLNDEKLLQPHIEPFEDLGRHYFYDVNRHKVIKINQEMFSVLKNGATANELSEIESFRPLLREGYLSSHRIRKIEHPHNMNLETLLSDRLLKICLQVTQGCNFRCEYCVYSGGYDNRNHTNKKMSWEMAKLGLDFLLKHSGDSPCIDIAFYGGEPLLELGLIRKCISYLENNGRGKDITFTMTTNGSLLTAEVFKELVDKKMKINISLDGPKEIHDKNRKLASGEGSYDTVIGNIAEIKRLYPDEMRNLTLSMVIDPEVRLSCITEYLFSENELLGEAGILSTIVTDNYRAQKLNFEKHFGEEWRYNKFLSYLNALGRVDYDSRIMDSANKRLWDLVDKNTFDYQPLRDNDHHSGPCVPGQLRLFMTVDGRFMPCERVSESSETMCIGDVFTGFKVDQVRKLLNIGELTADECADCFAFRGCTVCAMFADEGPELSKEQKLRQCANVKRDYLETLKDFSALSELGLRANFHKVTRAL